MSFTRAADALGVTASAVSVQIRTLEEYLARPLFRRNGREVHVTIFSGTDALIDGAKTLFQLALQRVEMVLNGLGQECYTRLRK